MIKNNFLFWLLSFLSKRHAEVYCNLAGNATLCVCCWCRHILFIRLGFIKICKKLIGVLPVLISIFTTAIVFRGCGWMSRICPGCWEVEGSFFTSWRVGRRNFRNGDGGLNLRRGLSICLSTKAARGHFELSMFKGCAIWTEAIWNMRMRRMFQQNFVRFHDLFFPKTSKFTTAASSKAKDISEIFIS